jgi:ribokinase
MLDLVVIGSANVDLVATTVRLPAPGETVIGTGYEEHAGGKGLNQAVAAARCGSTVAFVGAFGDDDAGRMLRSVATAEGIDVTAAAIRRGSPTGRALITVDAYGENSIVVIPGANATVGDDEPDGGNGDDPVAASIMGSRVVLAQLEVPIAAVVRTLRAAREAGARTVLNPAPAPPDGLPDELIACCDVVIPNEHEIELLGGVDALLQRGVGAVVVTRGAAGVLVADATTAERWTLDAYAVDPVDTTGAGDAFCGAFASRLAAGDPLDAAVRYAAAAGAIATTAHGAVPSLPRHEAIAALLAAQ